MEKIAIYSGTFDPITIGHLDIIKKALNIFDKIIIAIAHNPKKNPMFSISQRVELAKIATKDLKNIEIYEFSSLLVDFAKEKNVTHVIRGLRAVSDFEYELQMAYANNSLHNLLETIFLTPNIKNSFISSSIVRELIRYNGDFSHLVTKEVYDKIKSWKLGNEN